VSFSGVAIYRDFGEAMAPDHEQPFLSTVAATPGHRRWAAAILVISFLIFITALPFAHIRLPQVWTFIPAHQSALVMAGLIAAVLLLAQFKTLRISALLGLSCGYLFTALISAARLFTLPDVVSTAALPATGALSSVWLYMAVHAAFPLTVILYAALRARHPPGKLPVPLSGNLPILGALAAIAALASAVAAWATVGQTFLPDIMESNSYAAAMIAAVALIVGLSLSALLLLWRQGSRSALDLWLMVVMCTWIFDVGLSAVFSAENFDLGFYLGRIFALVAATLIPLVLLLEMPTLHARLARSVRAEQEHAHDLEESRRVFETSLDLILVTDRKGNFLRVSPSAMAILGYHPKEMLGQSATGFIHPDDLDATRHEMRSARKGRDTRNFESRYVHKNGHMVTLAWTGVWSEPEQRHFFIGRDMTEAKAAEAKLRHLAHYDQLTGLPNRVSLHGDLEEWLAGRRATSIAMLDLDGFKDINDTLGHSIGDRLLKGVARRLNEIASDRARVYRLGGDEFVAILPDCGDPREVAEMVDAMLLRITERFEIDGQALYIGASAGIAIGPPDGANSEELLANVDLALYDAKAQGGRTYRLFVPLLRARAQARRELDSELRRAFSENEFELFYQPQIRLGDGMLVGAEALLRWRHPQRGILAPGAFIDALADSPVVGDVGAWILRTACEQAGEWRGLGLPALRVAVNLFPAQFDRDGLVAEIEQVLRRTGVPADVLELEITENIGLSDEAKLLPPLQALRDKGVHLAFDDFGTGYASLSYLTRYPLSHIKIDKSFVRKIPDCARDTAIVRSIIVMAHNLGLQVIAEGVETQVQAAFLQAEGCDEVQGFLYGKPVAAEQFEQLLASFNESATIRAVPLLA
jgi:diguanylate cyclase (GGDEF)-like protein/PAS domain S-box-containing protein